MTRGLRILVVGAGGRLGREVVARAERRVWEVIALDHDQLDLTHRDLVLDALRAMRPDVVFHLAARNDAAHLEKHPHVAFAANAISAQNLALACEAAGSALVYVSANVVFSGSGRPFPQEYEEFDQPAPTSVLGASKYAGERCVVELTWRHYVVRTAWLFGGEGKAACLVDRVAAAARAGERLAMATDVWANPTYVPDLAEALLHLVETGAFGTYHLTNSGIATPYELATAVCTDVGAESRVQVSISESRGPAISNTALANRFGAAVLNRPIRPWQEALAEHLHLTDAR